jgi:uncharacterized protein
VASTDWTPTHDAAALVMARAPLPGRCKTRLQPRLGPDGCARLQSALVTAAADWAARVAPGRAVVAYDPPEERDLIASLVPEEVELVPQPEGDLGVKLADAVRAIDHRPLLVVGTDIPALSPEHAADVLAAADPEGFSLAPASDGGWWVAVLGTGVTEGFDHVATEDWGTERAFEATLAAFRATGVPVRALAREEHDLDLPEDADRALADPRVPETIKTALR